MRCFNFCYKRLMSNMRKLFPPPIYSIRNEKPDLLCLEQFGNSASNSFVNSLIPEKVQVKQFPPESHQVRNAHYSLGVPEKVSSPLLICFSESCSEDLGLSPNEGGRSLFLELFSGNYEFTSELNMLEGFRTPYASNYGCHSYGHWFGQTGDGRACNLGEITAANSNYSQNYIMQLKGSGRTPYSRHGDGRAVLRSCVREFLASESMHHLGVPTTRALCVVSTGEHVMRRWYNDKVSQAALSASPESQVSSYVDKYPPEAVHKEHGAIMTRVSCKSFVRIAQLELFCKRKELQCAQMLADYVIKVEYPEVLQEEGDSAVEGGDIDDVALMMAMGAADRYVSLYKHITARCAYLVTEWMRVGYTQGNMNSDNILIGGRTIG